MIRQVKINVTVVDQFSVFDFDGYTKVSGETNFVTTVWLDSVENATSVTITEIGTSGEYNIQFTPNNLGFWKVEVKVDYNKDIYVFEYTAVSGDTNDIYDGLIRVLGLSHENIFIDNTEFNSYSQLIAARVRLFDSKANCDAATDGGSETTGLVGSYQLTSSWQSVNRFAIFKQTKET